MDPLSVIGSSIAVIQVSVWVTKTLHELKQSIKNIGDRIDGLCNEIDRLTACLRSVQETLQETLANRQQIDLTLVGQDIWQQCDLAILDCFSTLTAVSTMAEKIKGTERRGGFIRRTKAAINWNDHSADLNALRDKLRMSHLALQTILQAITVSTSIRSYDSIHSVQLKLDRLKRSIDEASRAAMQPTGRFLQNDSDRGFIRNLRNLLYAAKQFHTSASSTAGSIREGTTGPWIANDDQAYSMSGDFSPIKRRWVENYVRAERDRGVLPIDSPHTAHNTHRPVMSTRQSHLSSKAASLADKESIISQAAHHKASMVTKRQDDEENRNVDSPDDYDDDCDDAEAEHGFQQRLQSLAQDMIRRHDYRNAVDFLHKALQSGVHTAAAKAERRQLQIQLTLCHFLQGDWEQAEASLYCLSRARNDRDAVVCTLLHALALAHLLRYSFDMALTIGQRALQGRKRLLQTGDIDVSEVDETRALLATIYKVRGGEDDYIRADVFHEQLSKDFSYIHPKNEVAFITSHPTLVQRVLGNDAPALGRRPLKEYDLSVATAPSWTAGLPTQALRKGLAAHERYEQDTGKGVILSEVAAEKPMSSVVAFIPELEASTIAATPTSSARSLLARMTTSSQSTIAASHESTPSAGKPSSAAISPTSRWLRMGRVVGLRKGSFFLRKSSPQKHSGKRLDEKRPGRTWISRRMTRKTTLASGKQVDCDDAGHRIMEWVRAQPCNIAAPSVSSETCSSSTDSEAGALIVSHVGCNIGASNNLSVDAVPFVPRFASSDRFSQLAGNHVYGLGPEWRHEIDNTQIAALDNHRGTRKDEMLESELNEIQISEINNPSSAEELSGNQTAQEDTVPKHGHFGWTHHGTHVTSAEAETVASFTNPQPRPYSSAPPLPCLSPTQVQRTRDSSEVRSHFLESIRETADGPLSILGSTQSETDGTMYPMCLRSPHMSSIPRGSRDGECLTTKCCPSKSPPTDGSAYLLPVLPTVIDSVDNRPPGSSSNTPRVAHMEECHATQVFFDDTRRENSSAKGSGIVAAEKPGDSGYTTIIVGSGDYGVETDEFGKSNIS